MIVDSKISALKTTLNSLKSVFKAHEFQFPFTDFHFFKLVAC